MTGSSTPGGAPQDPVLARRIRYLYIAASAAVVLAAAVELARVIHFGNPVGGHLALATTTTGAVLALWRPKAGVLLIAAGPLVAALLGWDPIVAWTIAVWCALAVTLRGLSGWYAGLLIGAANVTAVGMALGTIDVEMNPSAGVAGFAALAAAGAGSAVRNHHRYLSELHQRTNDAVVTRQAAVDRGIAEERLRIARDLHDGLGHRIAVLSMRLGSAEVHLPPGTHESRADLHAARTDLQAVLLETQQILQVLRVGDGVGDGAALGATHDRVPELVDSFRAAGLDVEPTLAGLARPLPLQVSAAVFRIVQELLTNARRHGTGPVALRVDLGGDAAVVESVNLIAAPARHRRTTEGGFGLVGLRERAASAGGTIDARPDGELFRVRASLPVDDGTHR